LSYSFSTVIQILYLQLSGTSFTFLRIYFRLLMLLFYIKIGQKLIVPLIIIIIRQFIRCHIMSESLQGRRTTSNANTWVANSYYILYDKENRYVLRRFLNVDVIGAVRMSGGKLFHAV